MTCGVAIGEDRVFLRQGPVRTVLPMTIALHPATDSDRRELDRLAALDSSEPLRGSVLLGRVDGVLRAALSTSDGRIVADPFSRTTTSSGSCARGRPDPQPRRGRALLDLGALLDALRDGFVALTATRSPRPGATS